MRRARHPWRIGIGQISIAMGDKQVNIRAIEQAIEVAAAARCDLLILPECALTGWLSPAARTAAEPIPGPVTAMLSHRARQHGLALVVGLEEQEQSRLYNSAVLIDREGSILLKHRKINELAVGLQLYSKGTSLKAVELDGVTVGIDICADSWTPHLVESLHLMGAQIIFSPCAWAIEPGGEAANVDWISHIYRSLTLDKSLYLITANGVGPVTQGPWQGKVLQGDSLVFGPNGQKVLQGPTNSADLLLCDLDFAEFGRG